MFDAVIVGIEGYEAGRDASALAKALASGEGEVTFVYVEVTQSEPMPAADGRPGDDAQRHGLERLARLRDEAQIAADVARIQAPSVRRGLHEFADGRGAELLVIGAGRHDHIAHLFLGDEAREVLEDPPCPVAVAPVGYSRCPGAIRKIGVAYDGSPESARALAMARQLTAQRRATLSAFEAVHAPVYARDVWNVEGQIDQDVEKARRRIAGLGGVEPHAELADDAVAGLRSYGASVDLLVLGAHRSTGRPPPGTQHVAAAR